MSSFIIHLINGRGRQKETKNLAGGQPLCKRLVREPKLRGQLSPIESEPEVDRGPDHDEPQNSGDKPSQQFSHEDEQQRTSASTVCPPELEAVETARDPPDPVSPG
jgi:hypothetical protein